MLVTFFPVLYYDNGWEFAVRIYIEVAIPMCFCYVQELVCAFAVGVLSECCRHTSEAFIQKIELPDADSDPEKDICPSKLVDGFWRTMTVEYKVMGTTIQRVCSFDASAIFACLILEHAWLALGMAAIAISSSRLAVQALAVVSVAAAFLWMMLRYLKGPADVTELCLAKRPWSRSIPLVAAKYFGTYGMSSQASIEHSIFVQCLNSTTVGMSIPLFGLLTKEQIFYNVRVVVGSLPFILSFMLKAAHMSETSDTSDVSTLLLGNKTQLLQTGRV